MNARSHIENRVAAGWQRWCDVGDTGIRSAADDDRSPALLGAGFEPVYICAVEQDFAEPDRGGNDQIGGDR